MKKALALFLAMLMLLCMVSCGGGTVKDDDGTLSERAEAIDYSTLVEVNLLENGDFSMGDKHWSTYTNGGSGSLNISTGKADLTIDSMGSLEYALQMYYDGFRLFQNGKYTFSFTAVSTQDKWIEPRIQINGGDYHAYVVDRVLVTTEPQTFNLDFDMTEETDIGPRLAFNVGFIDGDTATEPVTITFSDVSVVLHNQVIASDEKAQAPDININQIGYNTADTKFAYFRGETMDDEFRVVNEAGEAVYTGKIVRRTVNEEAYEYTYIGDFSKVKAEGKYKVETDTLGSSYEFTIQDGIFKEAFDATNYMLYLQRCGCAVDGGSFSHPACHTGKARIQGTTDQYIDATGGWHDAGDYGRYTVPGAQTVADLIFAYRLNPEAFTDDTGIPESGNGIPDVLDEAKYELDWLLKVQKSDGGVYHKVTCQKFPGFVMPEEETEELFAAKVSSPATADFAAIMAMAAVEYADIDAAYAEKCLAAAEKAFQYNLDNGMVSFKNSVLCETGEYPDGKDQDEMYWAACALYAATGDAKYHETISANFKPEFADQFGWENIGGLGNLIYLDMDKSLRDGDIYKQIKQSVIDKADALVESSKTDGYQISLDEYPWGSNLTVSNEAMLLIAANNVSPNKDYVKFASTHFDYIFGANPMAICYLTGFGTVSALHPHHRPSVAKGEAMPGMVIGGPDGALDDPFALSALEGTAPAKCYIDSDQSYSTNEVTIYWNSPLIYVMAGLDKC